ncbi:hypothetical protein J6590_072856 [Homalodisca vitripennis]|nr:hypothetical protein J6590_072856 [Homalodisca vitripennis]
MEEKFEETENEEQKHIDKIKHLLQLNADVQAQLTKEKNLHLKVQIVYEEQDLKLSQLIDASPRPQEPVKLASKTEQHFDTMQQQISDLRTSQICNQKLNSTLTELINPQTDQHLNPTPGDRQTRRENLIQNHLI